MISIICVFDNIEILNNYLMKSLKNQKIKCELILIDNTKERFESAAKALNYGARKAKGDYIMFIHQDVDLCSNTWLEEVEKVLTKLPNFGIVGVAGVKDVKGVITNIKHGKPPRLAGRIQIKKPIKVQTIDECLVIIPKSVFDIFQFDEKTCDNWHLYAVDYCLSVKQQFGLSVYVIPMYLYHLSSGAITPGYNQTLKKVLKKHKDSFKWIYTTCGCWNTLSTLNLLKMKMKLMISVLSKRTIFKPVMHPIQWWLHRIKLRFGEAAQQIGG